MASSGITRRIWLHLLKEGGRWSAADLGDALEYDRISAHGAVNAMVDGGTVQRYPKGADKRVSFGVTPKCKVPQSVTVADILACDLVPFIGKEAT